MVDRSSMRVTCLCCPSDYAAEDPDTLLSVLVDHYALAHPGEVGMLIRLLASERNCGTAKAEAPPDCP